MQALRQLSLVNMRIAAAPAFDHWQITVECTVDINAIASYMGRPASKFCPCLRNIPQTMLAWIALSHVLLCRPCAG